MVETPPVQRIEEVRFNRYAHLSAVEHLSVGGSVELTVNEQKLLIGGDNLEKMIDDELVRTALYLPMSLRSGETLENVISARKKGGVFSGFLTWFDVDRFVDYQKKHGQIYPAFNPGHLDEDGKLARLEVFLLQHGNRIPFPGNPLQDLPLDKRFSKLLECKGVENGLMVLKPKV